MGVGWVHRNINPEAGETAPGSTSTDPARRNYWLAAGRTGSNWQRSIYISLIPKASPFLSTTGKGIYMPKTEDSRPGYHVIYVAYITTRNGKRLYARSYGLRAFAIWVKD